MHRPQNSFSPLAISDSGKGVPRRSLVIFRRTLIALLVIYNITYALWFSPLHVHTAFFFDFSNFYAGSRTWLSGQNPYDLSEVYRVWEQSGHGLHFGMPDLQSQNLFAAIYPPSTLVMLAPLARLSAPAAHLIWFAISCVCFAITCVLLCSIGKVRGWEWKALLVLAMLAWNPGIGGIFGGELALPATTAAIGAVWALRRSRPILAGVLLGLAAALKIQIGVPFILYWLLVRQWRVVGVAAALFAIITLAGVMPLEHRGVPWVGQWVQNSERTLASGQLNDPRPNARFRDDMINLQTLIYSVTSNSREVDVLVTAIFIIATAIFLLSLSRTPKAQTDLLALSLVALLSFLPLYRRSYDMGMLALLAIWAARYWRTPLRNFSVVTLLLFASLFVPPELAPSIVKHTHLSANIVHSSWWQLLVVPHQAWSVLMLSGWCIFMFCAIHLRHPLRAAARIRDERDHHRIRPA